MPWGVGVGSYMGNHRSVGHEAEREGGAGQGPVLWFLWEGRGTGLALASVDSFRGLSGIGLSLVVWDPCNVWGR